MSLTNLRVGVANPSNPNVLEDVEFLIDSGAINSIVPTHILDKLGITPFSTREYRLANGDRIVRRRGAALFKYKDEVGVADVVFGEEGDSNLLGATTLETLGFALDPIRRQLVPLPMIL